MLLTLNHNDYMKCHLHLFKKSLFYPRKVQTETGIILRYQVEARFYGNNMTAPLKIKLMKKKKKKYEQVLMYTAINEDIRGNKKFKGFVYSQALSSRHYYNS